MEYKVTGCEDCPMFERKESMICNHPNSPRQIPTPLNQILEVEPIKMDDSGDDLTYIEWVVTPDWCPLKNEQLTLTFTNT